MTPDAAARDALAGAMFWSKLDADAILADLAAHGYVLHPATCPLDAETRARIEKPGVERAAVVAAILFGAVDDETFDSVMAALSDSEAPR